MAKVCISAKYYKSYGLMVEVVLSLHVHVEV